MPWHEAAAAPAPGGWGPTDAARRADEQLEAAIALTRDKSAAAAGSLSSEQGNGPDLFAAGGNWGAAATAKPSGGPAPDPELELEALVSEVDKLSLAPGAVPAAAVRQAAFAPAEPEPEPAPAPAAARRGGLGWQEKQRLARQADSGSRAWREFSGGQGKDSAVFGTKVAFSMGGKPRRRSREGKLHTAAVVHSPRAAAAAPAAAARAERQLEAAMAQMGVAGGGSPASAAAEDEEAIAICDVSGKDLLFGDWYHRAGEEYDVCAAEHAKLSPVDQQKYVKVMRLQDLGEDIKYFEHLLEGAPASPAGSPPSSEAARPEDDPPSSTGSRPSSEAAKRADEQLEAAISAAAGAAGSSAGAAGGEAARCWEAAVAAASAAAGGARGPTGAAAPPDDAPSDAALQQAMSAVAKQSAQLLSPAGPCLRVTRSADPLFPEGAELRVPDSSLQGGAGFVDIGSESGRPGEPRIVLRQGAKREAPLGGVSKVHAQLGVSAVGELWIVDAASSKGTFVNSQRLSQKREWSKPCALATGDVVRIGQMELCAWVPPPAVALAAAQPRAAPHAVDLQIQPSPAVVDTNILLDDREFDGLRRLVAQPRGSLVLIIPAVVLSELDGLKSNTDPERARRARRAAAWIFEHAKLRSPWLVVARPDQKDRAISEERQAVADDQILATAVYFDSHHRPRDPAIPAAPLALLTRDKILAVKAMAHGLATTTPCEHMARWPCGPVAAALALSQQSVATFGRA